MSSSKKFQILLILLFAFWGSFFIAKNSLANEIDSPIILNTYKVEIGDNAEVHIKGLISKNSYVLVYINQKYYNLAKIKEIDDQFNKFYYHSPLIKDEKKFEVMLISRDRNSLILSPLTVMTVKSVFVKNMADSVEILAKNQEKEVMLAKNSAFFQENTVILANNSSSENLEKSSLILDKKISEPILISPAFDALIGTPKPLITGLSESNTFVHFYIDGVYNGKSEILTHPSGTANFNYRPFLNLEVGQHNTWVVAENEQGQRSSKSNILNFVVEHPMPAPTLFTPGGRIMNPVNPLISGLAKNNSLIHVFVDHKLEKTFSIKNDPSGVGNFAYISKIPIGRGSHLVYATAKDKRGKESKWSNIGYFTKYRPKIIATTTAEAFFEEIATSASASINVEKISSASLGKVRGIREEKGIIEELKEEQKKKDSFNLNLTVFASFLIIIIVWMFLVNKGLKNETKAENKEIRDI